MSVRRIGLLCLFVLSASAQEKLTLEEAVATAVRNNPRLALDRVNARIAGEIVTEVRSGFFPTVVANTTAAGALNESRLAAGALNNPIIFNRYAAGASISQLITDFGRTSDLVESSRLRVRSQEENIQSTRAQITLTVHRTYFSALRAVGLLAVAGETVKARQLVAEQVTALAQSNLKSTLDVSFAEVNLSEARLAELSARNERMAMLADLSLALGYSRSRQWELQDVPAMTEAPPEAEGLIAEAIANRPELRTLKLQREAAARTASAERKLGLPTVSALANAGVAPVHDDRLRNRYAAAGINLSFPVFNGYLFDARRREADLRVQAIDEQIRELENFVAREITRAALDAQTAYQRVALTAQLLTQATLAAELAQDRYNLGLSSIVELSQAQLNQTAAQIRGTSAKYEYLMQRSALDFQAGRFQ